MKAVPSNSLLRRLKAVVDVAVTVATSAADLYSKRLCTNRIEAVPESSLVAFLYPHVVQWEWEIGEKAETELTEIEVYSVLRNGFGQYNTEYY